MDAATREQHWSLPLSGKINLAKQYILEVLSNANARSVIGWTGGKDSTTLVWLARLVCHESNLPMPHCIYIDDGDVFPEIDAFVTATTAAWDLAVTTIRNEDLLSKNPMLGEPLEVATLSEANQQHLQSIDFQQPFFTFEPESFAGSHLTKTVPLNDYLTAHAITHFFVGIRWDEQEQRLGDDYFVPRTTPPHTRVHPILHFTERDIWNAILSERIPFCDLYRQGYRSLGARATTRRLSTQPAWEQDLEHTDERAGRGQDKETVMDQLRSLGYM